MGASNSIAMPVLRTLETAPLNQLHSPHVCASNPTERNTRYFKHDIHHRASYTRAVKQLRYATLAPTGPRPVPGRSSFHYAGVPLLCHALALLLIFSTLNTTAQIVTAPPTPQWLTNPSSGTNQETLFAKSFGAELPLLKSILLGACEGRMEAYLNGDPIGQ